MIFLKRKPKPAACAGVFMTREEASRRVARLLAGGARAVSVCRCAAGWEVRIVRASTNRFLAKTVFG